VRISAFIEYCLLGAGVLGIVAGNIFGLPKGVELGIALVGLGFALAGLEAIVSRQMSLRFSDYGWDDWMGAPVLFGIGLLLFGAGMVIFIVTDRYGSKLRFIFVGLPRITVGVLSLVLGIAIMSAGAWEWFHHPSFERFANSTAQKLKLPSPTQAWRNTVAKLK
jgi:hypothetical protein